MLSEDIRHLSAQVAWFRRNDLLPPLTELLIQRLDALADRAAALEASVIPERARLTVTPDGQRVIALEIERARRRGTP